MGLVLHLLAAVLGLYLYKKRQRGWFVILLYAVMTSFFGYLPIGNVSKDIGVVMIVCTLVVTPHCAYSKHDPIGKWIIILLSYYTFRCICSILLGEESIFRSLRLVRVEYVLIAYFVLKRVPLDELRKAINILLYITIPLCLIQIIHVLSGQADFVSSIYGRSYMSIRMGLIPDTAVLFFAYLLFKEKRNTKEWIFLFIIVASIVLGNVRGLFLSVLITTVIFICKQGKFKYLLWGILFIPIMWVKFNENSQKANTVTELSATFDKISSGRINSIDVTDGNLAFRVVLVKERIEYLCENASRFIFGIGTIPEQSPNNNLSFYIGSGNLDEDGVYYRQQIETTDVAFITNLLRYGFMYFVIFICLISAIYKVCIKHRTIYSDVGIFTITVYLIAAPSCNYLSSINDLFPVLLAIVAGVKESIFDRNDLQIQK